MHTCEKCGKEFKFVYLLNKHKNRKNICNTVDNIRENFNNKIKNIENEINIKTQGSLEKENICLFCKVNQSNRNNTLRHIKKYCKIKKELLQLVDNIKKEEILLINEQQLDLRDIEINKLKEENNKLKKNLIIQNTPQNITINNPTINTINQNNLVVINPFGKEDLSHITLKDYKKYLNGFFRGFVDFIEKVHFDDNSNNKNICVTNFKSKNLSVHDGNKWITQDKNEVIGKLINNKYNILNNKYEEFEESNKINEETINNFKEFRINYDNNESKKYAKNKIISMIYDNKDKIKDKSKIKKNDVDTEEENSDSEIDDKPKKKTNKKKIIVETYSDSD
jgi:hypothetical protein